MKNKSRICMRIFLILCILLQIQPFLMDEGISHALPSSTIGSTTPLRIDVNGSVTKAVYGTVAGSVYGKDVSYVDINGNPWYIDKPYTKGSWGYDTTYGSDQIQQQVMNTSDPVLYQSVRYFMNQAGYLVDTPNGEYNVTLKFVENWATAAGQRKFDVTLEDSTVLQSFDIYAQCGSLTACDRSFKVLVKDGQLNIRFNMNGGANFATVSAIEIVPAGTMPVKPPVQSNLPGIRVNANGNSYVDTMGNVWMGDQLYKSGSWGYTRNYGVQQFSQPVKGTNDPTLYQSYQMFSDNEGYKFDLPNGTYDVKLKLVEDWAVAAEQRKFDVSLEGTKVLTAFDIFAQCGAFTACDQTFVTKVTDGQLNVQFNWNGGAGWAIVSAIEIVLHDVPTKVIAVSSETEVTLSWDALSNVTGYDVEVDGVVIDNQLNNSYVHMNLDPGTMHTYRVRAKNGLFVGNWSQEINKWTLPDIPQLIDASPTSSSITLNWTPIQGATGYDVETNNTILDTGNLTTYVHSSLNPNMQYTYRIRAKNESGNGKWSPIIAQSTLPAALNTLTTKAKDTSIQVSWNAIAGAISYDLEVDGVVITLLSGTTYFHVNLSPNTKHTYRIRSVGSQGSSEWSELVTAVTLPPIPENLHARSTNTSIQTAWNIAVGATGYDLEMDGIVVDTGLRHTYTHSPLIPNTEHTYRVRARNGSVVGEWSELISAMTLSDRPSNLRTSATSNEIQLKWDPVVGTIGYDVEVDGQIVDNGLNVTFLHSGLLPNSKHTYRVRSRNTGGTSEWSEYVTQETKLSKPENFRGVSTASTITLTWDSVNGATAYELIVDGALIQINNQTSYTHNGLIPNSRHVYRVRAKQGNEVGAWSETLSLATNLGTPKITRTEATSVTIAVYWEDVVGSTGYDIEVDGQVMDNGAHTTFTHTNLFPNTKHTYRVRAKAGVHLSAWSEAVTQWTKTNVPQITSASSTASSITVHWTSVAGSASYDIEVDGIVISGMTSNSYTHDKLEANTLHVYRVRANNVRGHGEWSPAFEKRTVQEIVVNAGKDNLFNFVILAPKKSGVNPYRITINYNPAELEVLDLSAVTPEIEQEVGLIKGTNIHIRTFNPGLIIFDVTAADKTFMNSIKLLVRTSEQAKVAYIIE
ncbi:hypothetical protein MH117_13495 [Paenibacillus sp. ACRRX]|uniref:fibronectin type III domain-containing protein n=1 Tax=Paenibacillus sp. ACRRX TaxID=2918206 RepID=UPI001EF53584|nr:malectin domain-containing carbohydrate-binding protein [Paenibacillus sp. ACRRX]MCG7408439.1 hypothetical protein [Paenibacillus sp. ACRRX]